MSDESFGDDRSIRIIRRIYPTSTETVRGLADEPLVVKQVWPNGNVEQKRIVNPERSYQVPTFVF